MILSEIVVKVHSLLLDNLPAKTKKTPSHWTVLNCPMCSDRRQRGGVKVDGSSIGYNCFNCGFSTRWEPGHKLSYNYRKLAQALGAVESDVHRVNLALMQFRSELEGYEGYTPASAPKFKTRDLPECAQLVTDLPDSHPVKEYAQQRRLLGTYPFVYFDYPTISDRIKWKDRLVVPFTHNGDLVGWTGRHINPPNKETPKYLTEQPEGYVFGLDSVHPEHKITVLVEGVLDAPLIGGISTMGKSVSEIQAQLINQLGTTVIVCPDRDDPGKELIEAALRNGWSVSFPPWAPGIKDAGEAVLEYGRLLTLASIVKHSVQNPTKIRVKTKML